VSEDPERHDGPTEVVETEDGEVIERLSGGTATLLLVWLIGVGSLSTLLAVWVLSLIFFGERLGIDELFSGFGFYTALAGSAGPCVLWLAGRAQGHSLGWFLGTAAKIALVMLAIVLAVIFLATLVMASAVPGPGALVAIGVMAIAALLLSAIWAVATWSADRWIARARVSEDGGPD
jgi:cation transporter-like permease